MSKIQVEVSFTDELESIRVGGKEMEIPRAIKTKPVEEWFEPTVGRVKWGGLGAEIKEMDSSKEKNAVYSFLFIGPEDKKQEFMACVERFCLGEEAQQETQEEASDAQQFSHCTKKLAQKLEGNSTLEGRFTPRQLEQIRDGAPRISGLTWHHTEHPGVMQLVDSDIHSKCRHTGGRNVWGGGSECR